MSDKLIDEYPLNLQYGSEKFETKEMCDKAVVKDTWAWHMYQISL